MKNEIILWISSLLILFLIGYTRSITDKDYPVSGTFGIEGKKVSYKLDKVSFGKSSYRNIILSDAEGLEGRILWRKDSQIHEAEYKKFESGLECEIPGYKPGSKIQYKVVLTYGIKSYEIPREGFVTLTFWGNIPSGVKAFTFIFLFSTILLSIRCLLEIFNNNKNLKKYAFINCSFLIVLTSIIIPLRNSYKLGAINNYIPNVLDLIDPILLLMLILWVTGTVFFFYRKYTRIVLITVALSSVLLFFFIR